MYIAFVKETGLGDDGRAIKIASESVPLIEDLVHPTLDGKVKFPAPAVDELVLVYDLDETGTVRFYTPIRTAFESLTDDADAIQLESNGELHLEGSTIKVGVAASESAVKGETLKGQLEDLITQIVVIQVPTAVGPSGPPINSAAIQALSALLVDILSGKVKVE